MTTHFADECSEYWQDQSERYSPAVTAEMAATWDDEAWWSLQEAQAGRELLEGSLAQRLADQSRQDWEAAVCRKAA